MNHYHNWARSLTEYEALNPLVSLKEFLESNMPLHFLNLYKALIFASSVIVVSTGKQRELYQNAEKVQKYRKTVKHLAEEGHKFEPCISFTTSDAEVGGLNLLPFSHPC